MLLPSGTALVPQSGPVAPSVQPSLQYDPTLLFENGTAFDDFASAIITEPGVVDFDVGDLNDDGRKDLAVISSETDAILIYERYSNGTFSRDPMRVVKSEMVDLQSVAIGDLDNDGLNDIVVSNNNSAGDPYITIFNQSNGFNPGLAFSKILRQPVPHEVRIGHFTNLAYDSVAVVCEGSSSSADDEVNIWSHPYQTILNDRTYLSIPAFTRSRYLASADLDGDGWTDIVVGNRQGANVVIYTHQVSGAWNPSPVTKAISGQATDVELNDIVGDSKADLIFADASTSSILVYLNTVAGFDVDSQVPVATYGGLTSVATGEVSGDNRADVIALTESVANVSAFFKRADTSWYGSVPNLTFPVNQNPKKAVIDRSLVGHEVLLVLSYGNGTSNGSLEIFQIHMQLTGNSNENRFFTNKPPEQMAVGRMADGSEITAITLPGSNQVSIYNQKTGLRRTLPSQAGPKDLIFGKFDGDSSDDLAILNQGAKTVSIYKDEQFSSGTQPQINISIPYSDATRLGKVNVRGTPSDDLVVGSGHGILILYNNGLSSMFQTDSNETLGVSITGETADIAASDFNNDGVSADLAILNAGTSTVELFFRSSGPGPEWYPSDPSKTLTKSGSSFKHMAMGNFGGNGYMDLAVLDNSDKLFIYRQPSYGFTVNLSTPHATIQLQDEGSELAAGDLNDDGMDDLAIAFSNLPEVASYLRTGDLTFKNSFNWTSGGIASDIDASDINGDLRPDVGCVCPTSRSLSLWFQDNLIPVANATASSYNALEGTIITFSGAGSKDSNTDQSTLQYLWTFSPSDKPTTISVVRSFLDQGTYHISLQVTDRGGLKNWSNVTVHITDLGPQANFIFSPSSLVEGTSVTFSDTSLSYPDALVSWNWSFGDNSYSTVRNITHVYQQNGAYQVRLRVWDDDNSMAEIIKPVVVTDTKPAAAFSFTPSTVQEGGSISFEDESVPAWDAIVNWTWSFGDGGVGYGSSIVHNFVHDGTFTVTLTIRDSDGSNSTSHQVKITDIAPVANFVFAPTDPIEGTTVTFNDTSSSYDGLTAWLWDFGEGNSSTSRNITHAFAQNGSYSVKLKVWEADGNTSEMTKVVNVSDSSIQADFWFTPLEPVEGTQVAFHDNSSDYDEIVYWHWDFRDGNSSNGKDVTHVYAQNGTYQVKLSIRDQDGTEANVTYPITISDTGPTASFTYAPLTIYEGQTVWYNDTSVAYDGIATWNWSFGDNSYSTVRNITHVYQQNGTYQVRLQIWDDDGSEAEIIESVLVLDTKPTAAFSLSSSTVHEGGNISFVDESVPGWDPIINWTWSFGDGGVSYESSVVHDYVYDGTFTVTLTVRDSDGIANSTSASVSILDLGPLANFSHTEPVEGALAFFNDTSTTPVDPIVNWSWDFGDGHVAWGARVTHAYNRTGSFLVSLAIKDDDGSTNSTSEWVSVADVKPGAMFTFSPSSLVEKDLVAFTDTSTTFNQLVEWYWDLGDGNHSSLKNPTHAYSRNGTYHVTLWVQEFDDSNSSHSVDLVILDTNPDIVTVSLQPAKSSFNEDESFQVYVYAIKAREDIARYEWDFHYDGTFQAEAGGSTNHTGHVYPQAGSYQVAVRVWDDDAFSQSSSLQLLNVEVVNLQPHAQFSFRNESAQQVQFDASYSSDTASDEPLLQFSWNFDDGGGFTAYSSQRIVIHSFPVDGMYNVTLRVRDNDGAIAIAYHKITLDRTVPTVTFDSNGGHIALNEAVTVAVNATDNVGLISVWLHYKIDNGTEVTVQMTSVGTANHFEGQIPGVNHTATITYWVVAFDSSQNNHTTGLHQILVMAAQVAALQDSTWLWLIVLAALIIAALLYLRGVAAAVEEVFIIYQDGRLMAHQTRRLKPGMDDEILSSMLVAIQSFVKDSFKDESATHLARLDFGKKKILVEKGELVILAVVLHGDRVGKVPQRMKQVMQAMDEQYSSVIRNWDGDLEKVRGIKDMASPLLAGTRIKSKKKEMLALTTIECPACGANIAPESKTCPSCSADLESGNVDALEAMAKDISEEGKK